MALDYVVTAFRNADIRRATMLEGQIETITIDAGPWVEDNSALTGATWTVEAGTASIGSVTTSSPTTSAPVTFSSSGGVLLKIILTTATEQTVVWIDVLVKDPSLTRTSADYGLVL